MVRGRTAAAALIAAAAALYSYVSLYRHNHFASNAVGLGMPDQTVWAYSRLEAIPNHFDPILATLAPFMWLWNSAGVLLVAQAVLLAGAAIPIYLWAERELGPAAGVAFAAAYLGFWDVLAGVIDDFHDVAFAVPAISLALYATLSKNNLLLIPAVIVAILSREDVALTVIALGAYVLVVQRRWVVGAALVGTSAAWFALLVGVVMPALGPAPEKVRALGGSLIAYALLPLASPILIVAIPSILKAVLSPSPNAASFFSADWMLPAPILAFAAIDACTGLRRLLNGRMPALTGLAMPVAAAAAGLVLTFVFIRPFPDTTSYQSTAHAAEIQSCLDAIPADASVTASNVLVPHLSHRAHVYEIGAQPDADYVAIDPATYRSFLAGEEDRLRQLVRGDLAAGFGVACANDTTLVLARVESRAQLTPELQRWLAGRCSGQACARD